MSRNLKSNGVIASLLLGMAMTGLPVTLAAQDPAPQNPAAQSSGADTAVRTAPAAALSAVAGMQNDGGAEDTSSTLPLIPALLGGIGISPAFLSEMERSNYLRAGINVGGAYDDNPLLATDGSVGNASVSIFPNIRIDQTSSRMRWSLGYAGGLTINQRFTDQNQGSHNLNFDSQYRLSPHVNLRVAETFSLTTGFFDAGNGAETVVGAGGPNPSLITPLATQRSSLTTVETNYHFALNDLVGASGSFYDLHFSNPSDVPAGAQLNQLTNSQTSTGTAFWLHQIVSGDWGGPSYRFQRITFNGGETEVHSFLAVDTLNLSNRISLTGFAGPQYSENEGLLAIGTKPDAWSFAGGAAAGWRNDRTSVTAGYAHTISDGGGVLGAVRLQNIYGSFRREFTPGWAVLLNADHGSNRSLVLPSVGTATSINLTSAGIAVERNVGKSFGLRFGYNHDFQDENFAPAASLPNLDASRNRCFVTFSYQWAKPLGM